jgi:hypothetical protein
MGLLWRKTDFCKLLSLSALNLVVDRLNMIILKKPSNTPVLFIMLNNSCIYIYITIRTRLHACLRPGVVKISFLSILYHVVMYINRRI